MTRLFDRMRAHGISIPYQSEADLEEAAALGPRLGRMLREATVVVADDVSDYFFAGTDQEVWHLVDDFPCLMLPYPDMWLEARRPSKIVSSEYGEESARGYPPAWGCFMQVTATDAAAGWMPAVFRGTPWTSPHPATKWVVTAALIVESRRGAATGPMAWWILELDELGRALLDDDGNARLLQLTMIQDEQVAQAMGASLLKPLLLAISFMHCKNVVTHVQDPPERLSRAHQRRHGHPLVSYRVVDINPFREVVRHEGGGASGVRRAMALHQRRGHFKTYSADAPLFGKHVGHWFWAQRLRGTIDSGQVEKTYRVRAGVSS